MSDNNSVLPEMLDLWQQSLNWQPTEQQQCQFQRLYELILTGNRQLNLTRITEPLEFWEKHLWDSLRGIAPLLEGAGEQERESRKSKAESRKSKVEGENSSFCLLPSAFCLQSSSLKIIDIGTGAGFPGIPVAIALPDSQVTLLDSTRKKIDFLHTLLVQMGIQNVNTLLGRAEIMGKQPQYHQTYDVALIRAVGSASVCAEYALPFLKPGGLAVLYRGHWTAEETEALQRTVKHLNGAIAANEGLTTPLSQSVRHYIYLPRLSHQAAKDGRKERKTD